MEGEARVGRAVENANKEAAGPVKDIRRFKVPKFKNKTFRSLHDPKDAYPTIKESTFKFYNFEGHTQTDSKEPYIIYLEKEKVEEACSKENKEYAKSIAIATRNIAVVAVVGFGALGLGYLVYRYVL